MEKQPATMDLERIKAYKWLKLAEGLTLIAAGIVFCCFYDNSDFTKAAGYGFATVLLVYGIIELLGSILIRRSIFSSDIFFGVVMVSFAIMLLRYSSVLAADGNFNGMITWIFGILLATYSLVLIVSGIFNVTPKDDEKKKVALAVFQFIAAGLLIGADVVLWIFGLRESDAGTNPVLVLIIGCSVILMGLASIGGVFLAFKTEKFVKKQNRASEEAEKAKAQAAVKEASAQQTEEDEDTITLKRVDKDSSAPVFDATTGKLDNGSSRKQIEDKKK